MKPTFTLNAQQVPQPPESSFWVDVLRWMVCVMDPADPRLGFIAGCLSHALKAGTLTDRQHEACDRIWAAVAADYQAGILVCQNTNPPLSQADRERIGKMN